MWPTAYNSTKISLLFITPIIPMNLFSYNIFNNYFTYIFDFDVNLGNRNFQNSFNTKLKRKQIHEYRRWQILTNRIELW